jgi:hypothetical protein
VYINAEARNVRFRIHITRSVKLSRKLIKATEEPPKYLDLKPLDYRVLSELRQLVHKKIEQSGSFPAVKKDLTSDRPSIPI